MSTGPFKFCENCRARNSSTGKFCSQCGEPLDSPAGPTLPMYGGLSGSNQQSSFSQRDKLQVQDSRALKPRTIITILSLLIVILVVAVLVLQFRPPQPNPTVGVQPISTSGVPITTQPPTNQCTGYDATGTQQANNLQEIKVPNGCVLILDGYSGSVGGVSWGKGGVIALGPGIYDNGQLTDGEWLIVLASIGQSKFCEKEHQLQSLGQADNTNHPLDGANWPSC